MTSQRNYSDYFNDIVESINKIKKFSGGMNFKEFQDDTKTRYVVIRAFEILGEATKCVPQKIKDKDQDIPMREMSGLRDKLIHHYFGVDLKIQWETIKNDIPVLEKKMKAFQSFLLKELQEQEE